MTELPADPTGMRLSRIVTAADFAHFMSRPSGRAAVIALVSVILLVPCFWLPRIEAGDLGSHSYNAWLTSLVHQGKAPGLWIAHQKNNILFDVLLSRLGGLTGFVVGERIAVCAVVLVFFWGAFSLVTVIGRGTAWFLLPLLIMLSYGWTFHAGFFNFYLSLGLSFIALAIFLRARGFVYLYVLPLVPLIWMAHPLGLFWLAAVASYVLLSKLLQSQWHWLLAGTAVTCMIPIHIYLSRRYSVLWWQGHYYDLLGMDQIVLGERYRLLAITLALTIVGCVVLQMFQTRGQRRHVGDFFPLPVQLYIVVVFGVLLLPDVVWLPQYEEPISFISSRFTLAIAVLGCGALGALRTRVLLVVLSSGVALAYFTFVYQDAANTYAMEAQAESLIARVPQNSRILTTIFPFRGFRVFVHHVADRACIGHCFNIDNYEPASAAFRLRAQTDNRIVVSNMRDANHMMLGDYIVRSEDLPLWQIFQCGPTEIDLCLRPLHPGSLLDISANGIQRANELSH